MEKKGWEISEKWAGSEGTAATRVPGGPLSGICISRRFLPRANPPDLRNSLPKVLTIIGAALSFTASSRKDEVSI
jgi:hypothetical protein